MSKRKEDVRPAKATETAFPFFQRRPAEDVGPIAYPILRVKQAGRLQGVVLSHDLIGCYTHWWGGRTVPCVGPACQACSGGDSRRWKGWLALWARKTAATVIAELTAATIGDVERFFNSHRTLRGSGLTLTRLGGRANGRIVCSLVELGESIELLPSAPNVAKILARMWGLDGILPLVDGPVLSMTGSSPQVIQETEGFNLSKLDSGA